MEDFRSMGYNLEEYILSAAPSISAFWLPRVEQLCSTMLFHNDILALEPADYD